MIKENYEVWTNDDIDNLPKGENTIKLVDLPPAIILKRWYNLDNIWNENLYFYKKDRKTGFLFAVSIGSTNSGVTFITKKAYYTEDDNLYDDSDDDSYFSFKELELSDIDSLQDMLMSIFEKDIDIENYNIMSLLK